MTPKDKIVLRHLDLFEEEKMLFDKLNANVAQPRHSCILKEILESLSKEYKHELAPEVFK